MCARQIYFTYIQACAQTISWTPAAHASIPGSEREKEREDEEGLREMEEGKA